MTFRIVRDGAEFDAPLTTEAVDQTGRKRRHRRHSAEGRSGRCSVAGGNGSLWSIRCDPPGREEDWELPSFTVRILGRDLIGQASIKNISGPITMAEFAGQSAQAGALAFVGYLALISISLGVLNLMPVPLLDGGHLLYYFVEMLKGSPVSDRAFEVGQRIGIAVLAMLMALAFFNDLSRLF